VAIASIVSPLPALCLSHASGSITLRVVNSGLDTLLKGTSVPVTFAVAGGVPSTELLTLPKTLVPDSSIDLSLERKFNFSVAGQFSLTYRVSLPNDIDTSDNRLVLPLSVFPLPVVSFADKFDTISVQLPYQLKAKEGFSTYKWSTGDNLSSLVVSQSGTYTLTVVDKNGCEASRKIVLLSVTSSPFIESGRYSVSPNPAHDYVSLTMNDGLPIEHVKLFNARAVMVSSLKVDNLPSVSLFVGDLPAGTYVIHVRTKNNEIIVKFLKQ
jgi:hypothetical protein